MQIFDQLYSSVSLYTVSQRIAKISPRPNHCSHYVKTILVSYFLIFHYDATATDKMYHNNVTIV